MAEIVAIFFFIFAVIEPIGSVTVYLGSKRRSDLQHQAAGDIPAG